MEDLRVTLLQQNIYWHEPSANRAMFEELIWGLEDSADLILLPEMFTTGFDMDPAPVAEPENLFTHKWLKQVAAQTNALIMGSYVVKVRDSYYNRLVAMQPDGQFHHYDKRHLFRMSGEDEKYSQGYRNITLTWKGWRIRPLICYDLRFPVWSRNRILEGEPEYDLLVYVANWPEARIHVWDTLLKARAIENLSYCAGVNRTGTDENKISYSGHSGIYHPSGECLHQLDDKPGVLSCSLSKGDLQKFRKHFPAHLDGDQFEIISAGE